MNIQKRIANDHEKLSVVRYIIWKNEQRLKTPLLPQATIDKVKMVIRTLEIDRDQIIARIKDSSPKL